MKVDHVNVWRPENVWAHQADYLNRFYNWWQAFYRTTYQLQVGPRAYAKFFKRVLGRQTTTVVFVHRNWVWDCPEEGWVLYVDRRGPAFHVRQGTSASQAWNVFEKFRSKVDAWFKANGAS